MPAAWIDVRCGQVDKVSYQSYIERFRFKKETLPLKKKDSIIIISPSFL